MENRQSESETLPLLRHRSKEMRSTCDAQVSNIPLGPGQDATEFSSPFETQSKLSIEDSDRDADEVSQSEMYMM